MIALLAGCGVELFGRIISNRIASWPRAVFGLGMQNETIDHATGRASGQAGCQAGAEGTLAFQGLPVGVIGRGLRTQYEGGAQLGRSGAQIQYRTNTLAIHDAAS